VEEEEEEEQEEEEEEKEVIHQAIDNKSHRGCLTQGIAEPTSLHPISHGFHHVLSFFFALHPLNGPWSC